MLKILALVDGSKSSSRAVRYVIEMSAACKDTPDVHIMRRVINAEVRLDLDYQEDSRAELEA